MQRERVNIKFVIPAMPGFFSLSNLYGDGGQIIGANKDPVVGWAIDQYNVVCPITPDLVEVDALAVLNPDGAVQNPIGTWGTLDDWIADQKQAHNVQDIL